MYTGMGQLFRFVKIFLFRFKLILIKLVEFNHRLKESRTFVRPSIYLRKITDESRLHDFLKAQKIFKGYINQKPLKALTKICYNVLAIPINCQIKES